MCRGERKIHGDIIISSWYPLWFLVYGYTSPPSALKWILTPCEITFFTWMCLVIKRQMGLMKCCTCGSGLWILMLVATQVPFNNNSFQMTWKKVIYITTLKTEKTSLILYYWYIKEASKHVRWIHRSKRLVCAGAIQLAYSQIWGMDWRMDGHIDR